MKRREEEEFRCGSEEEREADAECREGRAPRRSGFLDPDAPPMVLALMGLAGGRLFKW